MTTGLSDQQLQDAFKAGADEALLAGDLMISPRALRAVADLAITHLEAELYGLRIENQELRDK